MWKKLFFSKSFMVDNQFDNCVLLETSETVQGIIAQSDDDENYRTKVRELAREEDRGRASKWGLLIPNLES